jgi:hypothetical protein
MHKYFLKARNFEIQWLFFIAMSLFIIVLKGKKIAHSKEWGAKQATDLCPVFSGYSIKADGYNLSSVL